MADLEGAVERVSDVARRFDHKGGFPSESSDLRTILDALASITRERDAMREAVSEAVAALRTEIRANEMSANIMRDPARTGGWRGAENVANSYDRHALKLSAIKAKLSAALVNGEGG